MNKKYKYNIMTYKMKISKCGCGIKATKPKMTGGKIKEPEILKETKGKKELENLVLRANPQKYVSFR